MKRIIPIIAAVVAGGLLGYHFLGGKLVEEEERLYNGVLEADHIDVRAKVGEVVRAMPVEEGSEVSSGETLCELHTESFELMVRGAAAELRAQEARLAAMKEGARVQEVEQARAVLSQARIQSDKAEEDYGRFSRLYTRDAVSEFEMDNARVRRDLALKQEKQAQERYNLVLEGVRDEELKAQLAIVDRVESRLELYKIKLADAVITSPLKGVLVERYVDPGELAMQGSIIVTVADYAKLELKIYVPEDVVGRVRLGQEAEIFVDSFPGKTFCGRVVRKSREAEFTPKNVQTREERTTLVYEVTLLVENPEGLALAGLPADAKLLDTITKEKASSGVKAGGTGGKVPAKSPLPGGTGGPEN